MRPLVPALLTVISLAVALPVHATGLATCDSGPRETWQPQQEL